MENQSQISRNRSEDSIREGSITIVLNGESIETGSERTLLDLLKEQGVDPGRSGIAVARNDRLVRRTEWEEQMVEEGDRIEVITALQGG